MRRRFGRRRRSGSADDGRSSGIDPQWLSRVGEEARIPASSLVPLVADEVPANLALLGSGESEQGERCLVAVSRSGGDALIAVLAVASRLAEEEGFRGTALAVAPSWSLASRQRLGLVGELPYALRAETVPQLESLPATVEAEPMGPPAVVAPSQVHRHLARPADQELCRRALAALSGLAAKHGGAIRGVGRAVELVLLARRVAAVRVDEDGVLLDTWVGGRRTERLSTEALADALDRLEGSLRKHLNDREVRDGEPGLRSRLAPRLAEAAGLRAIVRWPLGGRDVDALDFAAVTASGRPAVGALRTQLTLSVLGPILDAAAALAPALPGLLESVPPPVRLESPCLVLGAERYDAAVIRVLGVLALEVTRYEILGAAGREPELRLATGAGKAADAADRPLAPRPERIAPSVSPPEQLPRERSGARGLERPTTARAARPGAERMRASQLEEDEGLPGFSEYTPAPPPRASRKYRYSSLPKRTPGPQAHSERTQMGVAEGAVAVVVDAAACVGERAQRATVDRKVTWSRPPKTSVHSRVRQASRSRSRARRSLSLARRWHPSPRTFPSSSKSPSLLTTTRKKPKKRPTPNASACGASVSCADAHGSRKRTPCLSRHVRQDRHARGEPRSSPMRIVTRLRRRPCSLGTFACWRESGSIRNPIS